MPSPDPPAGLSLGAALRWGANALGAAPTAMLDARVLMKSATAFDDAGLILNEAELLSVEALDKFAALIARRALHEPVAYIMGSREFWSLPIAVEPGILVPRADSETLVAAALSRRSDRGGHRILDLGCGSGALLCALLSSMPNATGVGADLSEQAVAVTNRNLARLGLASRGRAIVSNWTAEVIGSFDLIVSNPPYVALDVRGTLLREVEAFEDPRALFAGPDGLEAYRALALQLPGVAAPEALIVVELGAGQSDAVRSIFRPAFPDAAFETAADLAGIPRALIIDLAKGTR